MCTEVPSGVHARRLVDPIIMRRSIFPAAATADDWTHELESFGSTRTCRKFQDSPLFICLGLVWQCPRIPTPVPNGVYALKPPDTTCQRTHILPIRSECVQPRKSIPLLVLILVCAIALFRGNHCHLSRSLTWRTSALYLIQDRSME
jgi:hypothetical protein